MKRILLDQGLAPQAAAILRQHGLDAVHVSEIGMEQAEDVQILEKARVDEMVCVTLDHDFHAHLALTGNGRPSVVLMRVQGLDAQGQADLIRAVRPVTGQTGDGQTGDRRDVVRIVNADRTRTSAASHRPRSSADAHPWLAPVAAAALFPNP